MADGLTKELREVKPAAPLPERDVRARKSPLGGLLQFETVRRASRVTILTLLDVAGLVLAIWTALAIKTLIQSPDKLHRTIDQTQEVAPLACLVMLLLFARSGLYKDRGQRPGFAKVIASLFQV